ncbi:MAG: hypothetical protein WAK55_18020, partial [Xanthobacteraceae bacterium]
RGKAPHYRLTEEWYLDQAPSRDYQRWDGTKFREQKSAKHYQRKNRIPGAVVPPVWGQYCHQSEPQNQVTDT